jgi:protein-tyrosine phosphatase
MLLPLPTIIALVVLASATNAEPAVHVVGNVVYPSRADNTSQCLHAHRLCIGNMFAASNEAHIRAANITHIVSAIGEPDRRVPGATYLVLDLEDTEQQSLAAAFVQADRFIDAALASDSRARVLVHCAAGVSRSSALLIYHLMESYRLSFADALRQVRAVRSVVNPNRAFARQLQEFGAQQRMNNKRDL